MTEPEEPRIVVLGPGDAPSGESVPELPTDQIAQPAKVMRIGTMVKQLLEEVRAAPLDEASRARLRQIHERSIEELAEGLAPDLREELERITLPFGAGATPSDAELRIAQAQLVGWLEGLFHGIQTAIYAQQVAARAQFEQIRKALPAGMGGLAHGMAPEQAAAAPEPSGDGERGGMYLRRSPRLVRTAGDRPARAAAGRAGRRGRARRPGRRCGRATGARWRRRRGS